MIQHFDAIFDNGVLKPLVPLSLPTKTRVKVTVDSEAVGTISVLPQDEWERRMLRLAKDCGVSFSDSSVSSQGLYD
jgi:predicted DNA-binding antitoxin AbrB/MazE fold protein